MIYRYYHLLLLICLVLAKPAHVHGFFVTSLLEVILCLILGSPSPSQQRVAEDIDLQQCMPTDVAYANRLPTLDGTKLIYFY